MGVILPRWIIPYSVIYKYNGHYIYTHPWSPHYKCLDRECKYFADDDDNEIFGADYLYYRPYIKRIMQFFKLGMPSENDTAARDYNHILNKFQKQEEEKIKMFEIKDPRCLYRWPVKISRFLTPFNNIYF